MGILLCSWILSSIGILTDNCVDLDQVRQLNGSQTSKQAAKYDDRFATRERGPIKLGQRVVVKEPQTALSLAASEKENEVVME